MKTADKSILEKFELLLDNVNIQLWILHGIETYGVVNKAHADFIGKRKQDMENKKLKDILIEKDAIRCTDSNIKVWEEKKEVIFKEWVTNSKGEVRLLQITKTPILDEKGDIRYIVCKANDITEEEGKIVEYKSEEIDITKLKKKEKILQQEVEENKKRLDEMIEYDKLKTEFFTNISHELRTPLNLILSTLQLINYKARHSILEPKYIKRKHNIIKQNCYRLLRLINNLIDITKIDSGYFSINLKNYNVISIVEDITLSVAEYVKNKNINLLFDTEVEEKIIACDPDKIERIVLNLLSNAVKFTNPGGNIMVYIHDKGESIAIRVKDTGIGIPEDKIDMIFQRFRQIDKSFTRNHDGSGIGLSLTESLVKMHEGKMTVRSQYGKGSEFIIYLPVRIIEDSEEKTEKNINTNDHVESINIEFSDIYSINYNS